MSEKDAAAGGLTKEEVGQIVATAIATALGPITKQQADLAKNLDTVASTLAQLPPARADDKKSSDDKKTDGAPKALTAEDVIRILDDRDAKRNQSEAVTAERSKFIGSRLKNFPEAYQSRLGNDPAKFEDEAKQIEAAYQADAEKFGWKLQSAGGGSDAGGTKKSAADAIVDTSKMTPLSKLEMGLKTETPAK